LTYRGKYYSHVDLDAGSINAVGPTVVWLLASNIMFSKDDAQDRLHFFYEEAN
jgi:hypothetical protein